MENQFATYEIALALKELGFDEPCFGYYNDANTDPEISLPVAVDVVCLKFNLVKAPLWQQVIDWFREKYNIHIWVYYCMILDSHFYQIRHELNSNSYNHYSNDLDSNKMHEFTYKQAREQAILKTIELCQNKK